MSGHGALATDPLDRARFARRVMPGGEPDAPDRRRALDSGRRPAERRPTRHLKAP